MVYYDRLFIFLMPKTFGKGKLENLLNIIHILKIRDEIYILQEQKYFKKKIPIAEQNFGQINTAKHTV